MKKKLSLLLIAFLGIVGFMFAATMEATEETEATYPITATWDWQNKIPASIVDVNIQQTNEGDVASDVDDISLHVISTGGKLQYNSQGYAQFNTNTEIQVPVKNKGDEVTVVSYPGQSNYTVGGEDATGKNTFTHTATSAEASTGYVSIVASKTAYLYSIKVLQKAPKSDDEPVLAEKSIYKTDFSDWETAKPADEVNMNKQTKFTNETLTFSLHQTSSVATEDTKFSAYTTLPRMTLRAEKDLGSTITTSALGNITKVRFIHGATGSNRGWKLEAKGKEDADWVVVSANPANPQNWAEVTVYINKEDCQLRFTNLASNQNAFLFELEIFGKVDMSGAPLLGSFKANGKTYTGDDFEMGNSGNYEATFELFKSETMISANNPISDYVADNGEIGEITYAGDDDQCTVTIPVTAEGKTVNYVATFIRKPLITLTYLDLAGQKIGTQEVEKDDKIGAFNYDIAQVPATKEGYKARGWFKQNYVGEKWTTESVVTEDITLYAVETEIEVASTNRKYEFNLTDKNFDANDHEAFNPAGSGYYWHDATHGWAFKNGNTVDLLVGPKATIFVTLCQYGSGTGINVKKGEETLATLDGKSDSDGGVAAYNYEGEAGTVTLEMVTDDEMYIHSIRIVNTAETNYDLKGQWIYVKEGDASSFLDALDAANGMSGTDRVYVYLPYGIYDLGTATKTTISRDNISLIGESMEGVIIKNAPPVSVEGLMSASTIHNTSNNLYMQDLTLQNDLDYYGAGAAGRANAFHDGGNHTICKNVKLMSYQDTYLSTSNKQAYWENSEIHGAVDYICGGGDVFFENCKLVNESRKKDEKSGEATITAHQPQTAEKFGYVFNNCTIDNLAKTFNFGRAWGGASGATVRPTVTYLNTTLNQPEEIIKSRFIIKGMNSQSGVFHEYNSMNKEGNVVSPTSNTQTFTNKDDGDAQTYETILNAEAAAGYTIDKVFTEWTPVASTKQYKLTAKPTLKDNTITWTAVEGATSYAIFKNDELLAIVEGTSYTLEQPATSRGSEPTTTADVYTIRAINAMGGMGEPVVIIDSSATAINGINATENNSEKVIYNLQGVRMNTAQKGVYIINGKKVVMK